MFKKALLLSILLISINILVSSQSQEKFVSYAYDAGRYGEELTIKLKHMDAELKIIPEERKVIGKVTFLFSPYKSKTDSFIFYCPEITVSSVKLDNVDAMFKYFGDNVAIYPNKNLEFQKDYKVTFIYTARPTEGLYIIGWDDRKNIKRKQVWAHRPSHWLPFTTGRITSNMIVSVDSAYKVFTNGERISVKTNGKDRFKTWHYRMNKPNPFFSTALVIGDYDYAVSKTKRGIPLEYWYYAGQKDKVEPTYRYTEYMFEFLERELGCNYPWEVYREAPVEDYLYGAMETTTSTIYGDYMLVDKRGFMGRNYVNVNVHELIHQWYGNYITHIAGKEIWITEGMATHFAKQFEKEIFGDDYYQAVKDVEINGVFAEAALNSYPIENVSAGSNRWYKKLH